MGDGGCTEVLQWCTIEVQSSNASEVEPIVEPMIVEPVVTVTGDSHGAVTVIEVKSDSDSVEEPNAEPSSLGHTEWCRALEAENLVWDSVKEPSVEPSALADTEWCRALEAEASAAEAEAAVATSLSLSLSLAAEPSAAVEAAVVAEVFHVVEDPRVPEEGASSDEEQVVFAETKSGNQVGIG